ncbi:restriction endonuclease subunit S [Staphylococcus equorum]|uniref:restriction endonuclease subunit S n=1 Tax=Staphylococcus equorum TaxID=246432 RepID=UPI0028F73636|nr:restriction endonuclease subunit S [Staphylococcus equorum]
MMTNEVKNVPELRFPDFNEEWKSEKLGNISDRVRRKNQNLESKMPLTISGNLGLVDQVTYFSKSVSAKNLENYTLIKKGEFAYNKSYSNGYPLGAIKRLEKYDKGVLSTLYICFRFNENQNTEYMKQYFETSKWHKEVSAIAVEGARNHGLLNISVNEFFTILLSIPSLNEQNKIGDFFSKLDRQIELEEQKLSLLEEQKKGYMQKIFSQELRFKDENGNDYPNWIFEELNNIFTKYQNTTYLHDNEEYKRISISNKGKITHRDITFGKRIGRKRQYLIDLKKHPNTLTFIRQGVFLGGIGFIPSSLDGYIVTENMPLLSMSEEYSKKFMTYLFSSESYYKSVIFKNLPTGSAQKALHEKDWLKSFVNIPVYSEQEKIGNFFEKQDNLIKKQSDKVELLKERKKGFLQKMFV